MKYLIVFLSLLFIPTVNAKQLKVVVVDTGLDITDDRFKSHLCKDGHKDLTGHGLKDNVGHGTHVVGQIIKYAGNSNYCLIIVKFYNKFGNIRIYRNALNYVYSLDPDIVNLSVGGDSFIEEEVNLITGHPDTTFIVAAGNEHEDLNKIRYYPVELSKYYKNVIAVGALDENNKIWYGSNYGLKNMVWEPGVKILSTFPNGLNAYLTGTSMSTAIHTGKFIKKSN